MIANDLLIKINTATILRGAFYWWEFGLSLEGGHICTQWRGEDVAMIRSGCWKDTTKIFFYGN